MLFIRGKRKDDFLTKAATVQTTKDPKYKAWKSENSMVMSWLINSMTEETGEDFTCYKMDKEIWDAAKETY